MNLLDTAARFLSQSGYRVAQSGEELRFEDASILGFAVEFETAQDLVQNWRSAE